MKRPGGLVVLVALVLAGCSGGDTGGSAPVPGLSRLTGGAAAPATVEVEVVVVPGAGAAVDTAPRMRATVELSRVTAPLRLAADRGGYQTWIADDRTTLTLRGGLVTATRGLPFDLLAADAEAAAQAVNGRSPGSYPRSYRYTSGLRGIETRSYNCTLARAGAETVTVHGRQEATTRFTETCSDAAGGFRNDYWIGRDGRLKKSRQFLDPQGGYLTLQHAGG